MEAIDKLHDTAESHERIFFVEVMGRHSGYIAMMSGIAGGADHILTPEDPTYLDRLMNDLESSRKQGNKNQIVVVSEGDDAGSALEIANKVSSTSDFNDSRVTVLGHLQRGGSPTAFDRILASRLGVRAVEALIRGESGKMVGINADKVVLNPLSDAWESRTVFDPAFLEIAHILAN